MRGSLSRWWSGLLCRLGSHDWRHMNGVCCECGYEDDLFHGAETRRCPDDGACHHYCKRSCWRVFNAAPLSASGWNSWPASVVDRELREELR